MTLAAQGYQNIKLQYSTYVFSERLPIPIFSAPIYVATVQDSFGIFFNKIKRGCNILFFFFPDLSTKLM